MKTSFLTIVVFVKYILSIEANAAIDAGFETRRLGIKQCLELSLQILSTGNVRYNPEQLLCKFLVPGDMRCRCIRNTHSSKCFPPCVARDRCLTSRTKGHVCAPTGIAKTLPATSNTVGRPILTCLFGPNFCYASHVGRKCCSAAQQDNCFNVVSNPVSQGAIYNAIIRVKIVMPEAAKVKRILTISSGMNNTDSPGPFTNACSLVQKNTTVFLTGRFSDIPLPMLRKGHSEELDIGISLDALWSRIYCSVLAVNGKQMNLDISTFSVVNITSNHFWARIWFDCDEPGTEFVCIRTCENTHSLLKHFRKIRTYLFTAEMSLKFDTRRV